MALKVILIFLGCGILVGAAVYFFKIKMDK